MNDKTLLAPPGAGLPTVELLLSRLGFRFLRSALARHRIQDWLCAETGRVLETARRLPLEQMKRQVLIPRLTGLEDNSRDWSAAMVLQHLVIVDTGIGELLGALSEDRTFGREVRIADVKPTPDAGPEQLEQLEDALKTYLERVGAVENLHTVRRHAHPWFGPLDGQGWHTLAALHTMIHRRQLDAIVRMQKEHP
ncbi:DinB family protein [Pseudothauera rhizosphaerae]|uniref:DinB family protein n=1 Tax=Pseudothauera rhizosphaerae TaxID=2565932 RepID=A0A4S4AZT0_9RHOO|nr:DinB family protein [Pseudothauera rhizosphaerae]THF65269.1 DinB family protein [Pseudothauera rhizosphaerae]